MMEIIKADLKSLNIGMDTLSDSFINSTIESLLVPPKIKD